MMTVFLLGILGVSLMLLGWQMTRGGELSDELFHLSKSYERQRKVNDALLIVAREHKKKRDTYRHQLRLANRAAREMRIALDAKNEPLQSATSGPARSNPYMLKVGG